MPKKTVKKITKVVKSVAKPQKSKPKNKVLMERDRLNTLSNARSVKTQGRMSNSTPYFTFGAAEGGRGLSVMASELFMQSTTTSAFVTQSFALNPSNSSLFPKLQAIALLFDEFRWSKLRVKYIPACPNTRSGSVTMLIDPDISDSLPGTVTEMMNSQMAITGPVGQPMQLDYDPGVQRMKWFYTASLTADDQISINNSFALANRQDSPGNLVVATADSTSGDAALINGYFEVEYTILFRSMIPPNNLFGNLGTFLNPNISGNNIPLYNTSNIGLMGWINNGINLVNTVSSIPSRAAMLLKPGAYILRQLWRLVAPVVPASKSKRLPSFVKPLLIRQTAQSEKQTDYLFVEQDDSKDIKGNGSQNKPEVKQFEEPKTVRTKSSFTANPYLEIRQDEEGNFWGLLADGEWVEITSPAKDYVDGKYLPAVNEYTLDLNSFTTPSSTPVNLIHLTGTAAGAANVSDQTPISLTVPTWIYFNTASADDRPGSRLSFCFTKQNEDGTAFYSS